MIEAVTDTPYREDKLAELVLYIADKTRGDRAAGATKLNKYLYFADFSAMRKLGRPITGADYQKLPYGPAPRRLAPVRERLVQAGEARLEERVDALGFVHHDLIPMRAPRTELFPAEELQLVDEIIEAFKDRSATDVSEMSHRDAGWQLVGEGDSIPYELAFVLAPGDAAVTPTIRAEGERLLARYAERLA